MTDFIVEVSQPIGLGGSQGLSTSLIEGALTTLAAAKAFLRREDNSDDDTKIIMCVNHATGTIERECRRKLKSRVATFYLDGSGESQLALPEWPLNSVTSASLSAGEFVTPLDISEVLPHDGGVLSLYDSTFPLGIKNITVVADCGYKSGLHDSDLVDLEYACLVLAQVNFIKMNNQAYGATSVGIGGESASISQEPLPPEVAEVIKGFRRIC
jgi:hypothetical protein